METNVDGAFFTVRVAVPHLQEARGNLVFMSNITDQYSRPATSVYVATKW